MSCMPAAWLGRAPGRRAAAERRWPADGAVPLAPGPPTGGRAPVARRRAHELQSDECNVPS